MVSLELVTKNGPDRTYWPQYELIINILTSLTKIIEIFKSWVMANFPPSLVRLERAARAGAASSRFAPEAPVP